MFRINRLFISPSISHLKNLVFPNSRYLLGTLPRYLMSNQHSANFQANQQSFKKIEPKALRDSMSLLTDIPNEKIASFQEALDKYDSLNDITLLTTDEVLTLGLLMINIGLKLRAEDNHSEEPQAFYGDTISS